MKTVGPPYSGKLNVRWDGKGMVTDHDWASEALQLRKPAATDRPCLPSLNHSFTLDFIVTGKSKKLLETKVKPAIEGFLVERGLELSQEKTVIAYIKDGFTFLGQTFRKHGNTLHVTPSGEGVLALLRKVGDLIRQHRSAPMEGLIKKLNQTLRGWANYHRHVVSSEVFSRVDTYVYEQLWRMLGRRHQNKSKGWLISKYWTASGGKHVFSVILNYKGKKHLLKVVRVSSIGIRRHIKIKADANPYMPEYAGYFWRRKHDKESRMLGALSARAYRAMRAQEV